MSNVIFITGAGISAESGISTFRDSNGLWEKHDVMQICNMDTWENNYELVHKFYSQRRMQLNDVEPNEAHKTIRKIQEKYPDNTYIVTQNVDDLFERAGCEHVLHVHGFLTEMKCTSCVHIWDIGYNEFDHKNGKCPKCGETLIKPNVVFFGGVDHKYSSMMHALEAGFYDPNSLLVVVGTEGNVIYIDGIAAEYKGRSALCNLHESKYINKDYFDYVFQEPATQSLPKVEKLVDSIMG